MFKKLSFIVLAILFLAQGIAFATEPGYRTSPGRGEIVQMPYQSDPPKKFRVVRWVGAGAAESELAKDSIVIWDLTIDDGVTINTTTTSYDSSVAGILVTAALTQDTADNTAIQDIGRDNWAWLQTYGKSQADLCTLCTVPIAGAAMGTSSTAGKANVFLPSTTLSYANGYAGFYFDSATAGATDVECFVHTE